MLTVRQPTHTEKMELLDYLHWDLLDYSEGDIVDEQYQSALDELNSGVALVVEITDDTDNHLLRKLLITVIPTATTKPVIDCYEWETMEGIPLIREADVICEGGE